MNGEIGRRGALAGFGGAILAGVAAIRRRPPGVLLWRAQSASSEDEPSIVAGNGMVYVTGGGQSFGDSGTYAFSMATGERVWRTSGPRSYAAAPGAVFGFQVSSRDVTTVIASRVASGHTLWTHDAGHMLDSAKVGWLAYASGLVYFAPGTTEDNTAGQPTVRALDAHTGRRVWASYAGATPVTPAISGGVIYVSSTSQVIALNGRTGARLWTSAKLGGFPSMLAVVDGVVCASPFFSPASAAFGLDAATGHEVWHGSATGLPIGGTAGVAFYLTLSFGRSDSFTIQARHARSGQAIWKRGFSGDPALATANGVLYVGSGDRTLQAVAAGTGHTRWSYRLATPAADVTTSGNAVFVLDEHGGVYALSE